MKINSNTFETQSKGVSRGKNEEAKTGPATDQKLFTINMPPPPQVHLAVCRLGLKQKLQPGKRFG